MSMPVSFAAIHRFLWERYFPDVDVAEEEWDADPVATFAAIAEKKRRAGHYGCFYDKSDRQIFLTPPSARRNTEQITLSFVGDTLEVRHWWGMGRGQKLQMKLAAVLQTGDLDLFERLAAAIETEVGHD